MNVEPSPQEETIITILEADNLGTFEHTITGNLRFVYNSSANQMLVYNQNDRLVMIINKDHFVSAVLVKKEEDPS